MREGVTERREGSGIFFLNGTPWTGTATGTVELVESCGIYFHSGCRGIESITSSKVPGIASGGSLDGLRLLTGMRHDEGRSGEGAELTERRVQGAARGMR